MLICSSGPTIGGSSGRIHKNLMMIPLLKSVFFTAVEGTKWSDNVLKGSFRGYYGEAGSAWISVGVTSGTFDGSDNTWAAVWNGLIMNPAQYIDMVETPENLAALQNLTIPFAEVGSVELSWQKVTI